MLIKYIIMLVLGYVCYRLVKSVMHPGPDRMREVDGQGMGRIDDVMVKDPQCEVYFPRRNGVHLRKNGKDMYFCSRKCRDEFVAGKK